MLISSSKFYNDNDHKIVWPKLRETILLYIELFLSYGTWNKIKL